MLVFVIKKIRIEKNITLYGLSKRTGISRTYLRSLENNKKSNPTMKTLSAIANVLNVNIKDLFYSEIEIDNLRKEMNKRINKYGLDAKETLEISQIIDLLVNIEMNEKKTSQ